MATKFIKVNVSKSYFSEVYIKVDDDHPQYKDMFSKGGKLVGYHFPFGVIEKAVEKTVKSYEWEEPDPPDIEWHGMKAMEEKEIAGYSAWDPIKNEVFKVPSEADQGHQSP